MNYSEKKHKESKSKKSLMANINFNKFIVFAFLFFSLIFVGCQDEINEITVGDDEEQVLETGSHVASLMKSTVTKDGSSDNILDNSSCFNIQLPVNIHVNGLEIIIDSEEDFDTIEAVFDEYYDDDDYLEYIFPITIVLADYSEITIENKDQLEDYMDICEDEGDDDDIECVDFKYPISYSVFNTAENKVTKIEIHNDREMYHFIKNINKNDVVSVNFPITLVYTDGEEIVIHNMDDLENALEQGAEFCDEDDDNDYNDDDFDLERLNNLLVKCPWIVHDLIRDNTSLTDEYREFLVVFGENDVIFAKSRSGNVAIGTWETDMTDHGVVLKIMLDDYKDFTLTWKVADINHDRIKLYSPEHGRIILEKKCDIVFEHTIERIKNILSECIWRVDRLHIEGVDKVGQYISTPVKFFENGVAKLRINGSFIEGTWDIIEADINDGYILKMYFDNYPDLNLKWHIRLLENHRIKLWNNNNEMILKRVCPEEDEDVTYINEILIDGLWKVANYETEDGNLTEEYGEYVIGFHESGKVFVEGEGQNIIGSWISYRNDGKLRLGLNFENQVPFDDFNYRWKIYEISDNRIKLVDFDSNGGMERYLILEK